MNTTSSFVHDCTIHLQEQLETIFQTMNINLISFVVKMLLVLFVDKYIVYLHQLYVVFGN